MPSSHVLCYRATWKKQPLTLALKLPWLISQVHRKRKRGVVFLSSPHQFANWLWMGAILKHANVGSLCLYQLMQVSVVFGRALKARGEKDVLRVRKGRINSSGITFHGWDPVNGSIVGWVSARGKQTLSGSSSLAPSLLFEVTYLSGV